MVQRKATKFILKNDDPYGIRLKELNLMSLEKKVTSWFDILI